MLAALAFLLSTTTIPHPLSVAPISLEELVRWSDVVVVGRVERVVPLARSEPPNWVPKEGERYSMDWEHSRDLLKELPVAELVVERILEGPPGLQSARFLAMGTWMCDITSAKAGDRGLYFLREDRIESTLPGFMGSIRTATQGAPFYQVMHSGRGAMPFVGDPTLARVKCWDDVKLPEALLLWSGHDAKYDFIHHVPLDLLETEVRNHVSRQLPFVRVNAPHRGKDQAAWSLSAWGDGVIELWIEREENPQVDVAPNKSGVETWMKRLESERFFALSPSIGVPNTAPQSIEIEAQTATNWRRIVIGDFAKSAAIETDSELARALRLYAHLRDLVSVQGASDDRPRIRELLERAR